MQRRRFLQLCGGVATATGAATAAYLLAPHVVAAGGASQQARTHVMLSRPTPATAQPLTLRQAWQLALRQGKNWSADAGIVSLSSTDQVAAGVSAERADAGSKGTHALWNAILAAPSKPSMQLLIRLENGSVVQQVSQPRTLELPPITTVPALDSTEAVAIARSGQPPLGPAGGKSHGYGYTLQTAPDGRATLAVIGSIQWMPAKVEFDAVTGKRLGASVYTFSHGGAIFSADAGQTWQASNLTGRQIQQVVAAPGQSGSAYAVATAGLAAIPQADGTVLAVAMSSGLWLSRDDGVTWTRSTSLSTGSAPWLAATGSMLLASVASTSAGIAGVYASSDFRHWQRLLPETYRLSTIANGQAAVALSNSGGTTAHVIRGMSLRQLTLPIPALRAAGTDVAGQPFLIGDGQDVALSNDGGSSWKTTLRTNSASIAVAPPGKGSGVVLVSGFRTGLFRSADAGRTWRQVVPDVSAILPGSNEVGSLTFLGPHAVVAAQGAFQTWQPL